MWIGTTGTGSTGSKGSTGIKGKDSDGDVVFELNADMASSFADALGSQQEEEENTNTNTLTAANTAQYNLGVCYDGGNLGLTQSSKRAIEYYTLAANQGHPDAQYNLGQMYVRGECIEQSDK